MTNQVSYFQHFQLALFIEFSSSAEKSSNDINYSLARLILTPRTLSTYKSNFKMLYLNIPCPKCKQGDCFWRCQLCLKRLRYDGELIFCKCGYGFLSEYEFNCIGKGHGEQYHTFREDEIYRVLEKLKLKKTINILLLGLTGTGKTVFINSFLNYLKYESLQEAKQKPLSYLVPTLLNITYEDYSTKEVQIGKKCETERLVSGESSTRSPRIHTIAYNDITFNLIDTPVGIFV